MKLLHDLLVVLHTDRFLRLLGAYDLRRQAGSPGCLDLNVCERVRVKARKGIQRDETAERQIPLESFTWSLFTCSSETLSHQSHSEVCDDYCLPRGLMEYSLAQCSRVSPSLSL